MGHSRLITNGLSDNQPVIREDILALHNGIIVNDSEIWNKLQSKRTLMIDSEVIVAIAEEALKENVGIEHIAEKILSGKLKKFFEENTLLNQKFVMDPENSVSKVLENNNQVLVDFVRFKVGEGIDRKESDFAAEVKDIVS